MEKTIEIKRVKEGLVHIDNGVRDGWVTIGERMDGATGLVSEGALQHWATPGLAEMVEQTMADGQTRELVIGADSQSAPAKTDGRCPHCGTYCYGDCQAHD